MQTSDLAKIDQFSLDFNDAGTLRYLQPEQIVFFEDNQLGTQSTSHEFYIAGHVERNVSSSSTAVYYLLAGAFHPTNNSLEILYRKAFSAGQIGGFPVDVNRVYPKFLNYDYFLDGFRSIFSDPADTENTIVSIHFSNAKVSTDPTTES